MTRNTTIIALVLAIAAAGPAFAQTAPIVPSDRTPPGSSPPAALPSGKMPVAEPTKGMPASGMISTDMEAAARLEADGYRDIKMTRDTDGMWRGTATRGSAQLKVSLDSHGTVITQ
jgi:hypothetical protein